MKKYEFNVEGMRCGMCEAHVNESVKKNANVKIKKVTSSKDENKTLVVAEDGLDVKKIKAGIEELGFKVNGVVEK